MQGLNPGKLDLQFNKVPSARAYMCQFATGAITPETKWESKTTTVRKNTLTNLQSGVRYWVRVAAVGIKNQIAYSEPVSRVVQ